MLRGRGCYHRAYSDAVGWMAGGPAGRSAGICLMANYLIMAAMKGRFVSEQGNLYDNFQMLGYVEGASPFEAVCAFFDQPRFPIV